MPFIEGTVDSELSGNMIDLCPVGALNSKPYRFSARTWELRRSESVARHDAWGSFTYVHAKEQQIKRVLPREHEEINQCWIADRDRFAYTGINSPERLLTPYMREAGAGKAKRFAWQICLDSAAAAIAARRQRARSRQDRCAARGRRCRAKRRCWPPTCSARWVCPTSTSGCASRISHSTASCRGCRGWAAPSRISPISTARC